MKKTLFLTAIAALAVPALGTAQDVQFDRFRVESTAGAPAVRTWTGSFQSQAYLDRDIWCVDQTGLTVAGLEYDVAVTRMTSADFSFTTNNAPSQYQFAAFMTGFYGAKDGSTIPIGAVVYSELALQSAIWRVMGFSGFNGGSIPNAGSQAYIDGTAILAYFAVPANQAGLALIDFSKWYVVTPIANCNPIVPRGSGLTNGCNYQEIIVYDPDRPQETVPEPATMTLLATGLAGLAAARRRRKQG